MADNRALVRDVLIAKLKDTLGKQPFRVWNRWGATWFNFADCAEHVADILLPFYYANNRMPNVIFNDGVGGVFSGLPKELLDVNVASYVFAVNVATVPGSVYLATVGVDDNGTDRLDWRPIPPYIHGTAMYADAHSWEWHMPESKIQYGAFPTWGILLVAYTNPELLMATDAGIMLRPQGVTMIQKALPYWLGFKMDNWSLSSIAEQYFVAPTLVGVPEEIIDKIAEMVRKLNNAGAGWRVFLEGLTMAIAMYFGASAVAGLAAGALTIPNLTGALNMIQRLSGADLGGLTTALRLIGLTAGPDAFNTAGSSATQAAPPVLTMDDDFLTSIGIAPSSISYDDLGGTSWFADMENNWGNGDWGIDPMTINFGTPPYVPIEGGDTITNEEFNNMVGTLNQAPGYDEIAISTSNDAALAQSLGPLSATQYMTAAGAAPQAISTAQQILRATGGSGSTTATTPAQAARAAQTAGQQSQQAAAAGNNPLASVFAAAQQALTLYTNYQRAANPNAIPPKTQYPGVGQSTRQPDGSITVRNADGSYTTIRPNGQPVTTGAGMQLPSFMSNKTVLIAGGFAAAAAAILIAKRR